MNNFIKVTTKDGVYSVNINHIIFVECKKEGTALIGHTLMGNDRCYLHTLQSYEEVIAMINA